MHLDAAVSTGELASGAVADALLDGAGARPAAVGRRSDDPPGAPTSTETAARTARRPRLPVVGHYAVDRYMPCRQTNNIQNDLIHNDDRFSDVHV